MCNAIYACDEKWKPTNESSTATTRMHRTDCRGVHPAGSAEMYSNSATATLSCFDFPGEFSLVLSCQRCRLFYGYNNNKWTYYCRCWLYVCVGTFVLMTKLQQVELAGVFSLQQLKKRLKAQPHNCWWRKNTKIPLALTKFGAVQMDADLRSKFIIHVIVCYFRYIFLFILKLVYNFWRFHYSQFDWGEISAQVE